MYVCIYIYIYIYMLFPRTSLRESGAPVWGPVSAICRAAAEAHGVED